MGFRLALCCMLLLLTADTLPAENNYNSTVPSNRMREKAKSFSLASAAPEDCEIYVEFEGLSQRFAQFRYGTSDSTRVLIVLDQLSESIEDFELYVDLNRDREITVDEKILGDGKTRDIELPVEINNASSAEYVDRKIQFRKSIDQNRFSIKTKGGYSARCEIAGKTVDVWRSDGNANGLFSDVEDELWIDLDGNGKWNPIKERFLFRSAIKVGEKRYAVRGNRLGSKIDFSEIEGEGQLSLDLGLAPETTVKNIKASIFGDDGSAHSIEDETPIVLPVGKYMIGQISLKLQIAEDRPWHFSFSHSGDPASQRWVEVTKSGDTVIEPFSDLDFSISSADSYTLGKDLFVRPGLKTSDNLYITSSGRGKIDRWNGVSGNDASICATDSGQREIALESTGFR